MMDQFARRLFSNSTATIAFGVAILLAIWWPMGELSLFLESNVPSVKQPAEFAQGAIMAASVLVPVYMFRAFRMFAWSETYLWVLLAWATIAIVLSMSAGESAAAAQARALSLVECLNKAGGITARGICYNAHSHHGAPLSMVLLYGSWALLALAVSLWALANQKSHQKVRLST